MLSQQGSVLLVATDRPASLKRHLQAEILSTALCAVVCCKTYATARTSSFAGAEIPVILLLAFAKNPERVAPCINDFYHCLKQALMEDIS